MSRVSRIVASVLASSVLPTPGLALEEERPAELEGQEDRRRERPVADVVGACGSARRCRQTRAGGSLVGGAVDRSLVLAGHGRKSTRRRPNGRFPSAVRPGTLAGHTSDQGCRRRSPTMCCLLAVAALFGPRALGFVWWLLDPVRWGTAFPTAIIGILGWAFLPWTTVAYVFVYTNGDGRPRLGPRHRGHLRRTSRRTAASRLPAQGPRLELLIRRLTATGACSTGASRSALGGVELPGVGAGSGTASTG